MYLLRLLIVGTSYDCLNEAILISTHKLGFRPKIIEKYTHQFFFIKVGLTGILYIDIILMPVFWKTSSQFIVNSSDLFFKGLSAYLGNRT